MSNMYIYAHQNVIITDSQIATFIVTYNDNYPQPSIGDEYLEGCFVTHSQDDNICNNIYTNHTNTTGMYEFD